MALRPLFFWMQVDKGLIMRPEQPQTRPEDPAGPGGVPHMFGEPEL
jgi:hypothetical protein